MLTSGPREEGGKEKILPEERGEIGKHPKIGGKYYCFIHVYFLRAGPSASEMRLNHTV